ncbi:FecR family protein [Variovorax dokdonensis]|uniref:FecR family protein n=1 Tax=Variovorax dokdonensis TaxID=344883 RepID=A0ABT7N4Z1_9BURK|nr:FecR family protein [Variovorax dokdonensis]MDM0043019.1 FecR family protein [Variovorax dokdonensis]
MPACLGSNKNLEGNNMLTRMLTAGVAGLAFAASVSAQTIAAVDATTSPPVAVPATSAPSAEAAASGRTADRVHAGFVKSVDGTVRIIGNTGTSKVAKPGDSLAASDRVETDAESGASVVLRDGTMMVVGPLSQLDLLQFGFDSTTHDGNVFVKLLRGSMRMVTGLIGKKNHDAIRVDTQTATIGIRGTDFIVTADGSS